MYSSIYILVYLSIYLRMHNISMYVYIYIYAQRHTPLASFWPSGPCNEPSVSSLPMPAWSSLEARVWRLAGHDRSLPVKSRESAHPKLACSVPPKCWPCPGISFPPPPRVKCELSKWWTPFGHFNGKPRKSEISRLTGRSPASRGSPPDG